MKKHLYILSFASLLNATAQSEFDYKEFTKTMCSSEFHGRGYVNAGDSIAAQYIAAAFSKIGIKPIQSSYFQSFSFNVNTFPNEVSFKVNDEALQPGIDFISMPQSSGTWKNRSCTEIVYTPIYISGKDFIENYRYYLAKGKKNKILVVKNDTHSKDSSLNLHFLIEDYAKKHNVIEVVEDKFTWSVRQNAFDNLYLQIQKSALQNMASTDLFSIHIDQKFQNSHTSNNVIGIIPAKRKSKGSIMISAHYDHLGRFGNKTLFPGANDNASGVAMMLYLGQKFKTKPLRKTDIVLVAFAGEEIGLLGSKHLSEHPLFPLEKICFQLNLDIMGSGEKGITAVNGTLFKKQFRQLSNLNKRLKSVPNVKSRGRAANSDHHFFTEKGVPGFFIYTRGYNQNYHDVNDTFENLSFNSFENLSVLFDLFLRRL